MPAVEGGSTRRSSPRVATADGLRHDPAFRRFWSAHAISTAGSTVSLVVLPILMFQLTGSALLTALIDTCYIAPYVLLGLFAGALADRVNRRWLMIGCEFASAVALGSIPLASAMGVLTAAQIFVAATIAGVTFLGFDSAQFGALPALFGQARLITAMTALGSVDNGRPGRSHRGVRRCAHRAAGHVAGAGRQHHRRLARPGALRQGLASACSSAYSCSYRPTDQREDRRRSDGQLRTA